MRYQERIYSQTQHSGVRNYKKNNVNMSSDIYTFETPLFNVSGATKINCTGNTLSDGIHIVSTSNTNTIPLTFYFTANTQTFLESDPNFKYSIFKYTPIFSGFTTTPIFTSESIKYSAFSATNTTTQYVPTSGLTLDGEYLIKGFFEYNANTDYLNKLNKVIDTSVYLYGTEYDIYDDNLDHYFIAFTSAATPTLINSDVGVPINYLYQSIFLPEPNTTNILIPNTPNGDFILTLNGLALSKGYDYTYSGSVITLFGPTVEDDIVTLIYTPLNSETLTIDNIDIIDPIPSGPTDGEGNNLFYYNTSTGKYEVYTSIKSNELSKIIVMINGATLADGVDYYISTTNPKRIILEGDLVDGDLITLVYYPYLTSYNNINTKVITVNWEITPPPQTSEGTFTLEVSNNSSFSTFYFTGNTSYIENIPIYTNSFTVSGSIGTQYYYRVKNNKKYTTICGSEMNSVAYSEAIPIKIITNSINSY